MALAVLRHIQHGDEALMRRVNNWDAPRWVRLWMVAATRCGDGWLWHSIAVLIAIFGGPEKSQALWSLSLSAATSILNYVWIKKLTHRTRPYDLAPHVWATVKPPDKYSFPSGHTMSSFAAAFSLAPFYPHLAVPLALAAANIGISRVVLGMHFFTDVVAGCAFGTAIGYFISSVIIN